MASGLWKESGAEKRAGVLGEVRSHSISQSFLPFSCCVARLHYSLDNECLKGRQARIGRWYIRRQTEQRASWRGREGRRGRRRHFLSSRSSWANEMSPNLGSERRMKQSSLSGRCMRLDSDRRGNVQTRGHCFLFKEAF